MFKENHRQTFPIEQYEEAADLIRKVGILPLAALIPGHPSLDSVTLKEHWFTGTDKDPWLWRARFPADGTAAYGKFMKKKAVLVSRDWFPLILKVLGSADDPQSRYQDGLLPKAAVDLFQLIQEDEGIGTRTLRSRADMKAPEMKKTFESGILELQSSIAIVISGIKEHITDSGEKVGWNSTAYETADCWLGRCGVVRFEGSKQGAQAELKQRMEQVCSPEALGYLKKVFRIQ